MVSIFMLRCSRYDGRRHRITSRKNVARNTAAMPRNRLHHRRLFLALSIGVTNIIVVGFHNATLRRYLNSTHPYLRRASNASTRASRLRASYGGGGTVVVFLCIAYVMACWSVCVYHRVPSLCYGLRGCARIAEHPAPVVVSVAVCGS